MWFFALQGESATEILKTLQKVYDVSTLSCCAVSLWVTAYKCGRQTVEDEPCSYRPICVSRKYMCKKIQEFVNEYRGVLHFIR